LAYLLFLIIKTLMADPSYEEEIDHINEDFVLLNIFALYCLF